MNTLEEIQKDFLTAINSESDKEKLLKHIRPSKKLTEESLFNIYQNSITECLANTLRDIYKVCKKLVGDDFFDGLAFTYIKHYPSHSPDLNNYGEDFAAFIESFPPAEPLPYLADVCRLCWYWHNAHLSKPHKPFDIKKLTELSETQQEKIIFLLPKQSYLLASTFPVHQIWQMCRTENDSEQINLDQGGEKLFIWRHGANVQIDLLNDNEWLLLDALKQEKTINEIQQHIKNDQFDLSTLLSTFLKNGWLEHFAIEQ